MCGSPLKELTDGNEAVENTENKMAIRKNEWQQAENSRSTGQRRGWKHKEHTKVGMIVLILYKDLIRTSTFSKTHVLQKQTNLDRER